MLTPIFLLKIAYFSSFYDFGVDKSLKIYYYLMFLKIKKSERRKDMKELFIAGVFVFIALAGYWIFIWISAILIEKKIIKTVKKIIQFSLEM